MIDSEKIADSSFLSDWIADALRNVSASTFSKNLLPVTSAAFLWRDERFGNLGLEISRRFPRMKPPALDGYITTFGRQVIGKVTLWWAVQKLNWIGDCSPPLVVLSEGPVQGVRFRGSGRLRSAFTLQVLSDVFPKRI